MDSPTTRVAVAQLAGKLFDATATLEKVESFCRQAAAQGVRLIVFPEATLGGYPKGITFGTAVGMRSPEGREWFRRYWQGAVEVPGAETGRLQELADELSLVIVTGVIERRGGTLCCSALTFRPGAPFVSHRKLMPTAAERLIWGFGDGSTMKAVETSAGRLGCAICWENYMPAYRLYLYSQGVEIWCAPTVDDREMWRTSMRHIACEGRCFVLSACQYLLRADCPPDYAPLQGDNPETVMIAGGSLIVSPLGEVLAGPLLGMEGLLMADLDLGEVARGKFDLDVSGHYARPDIFSLEVDTRSRSAVTERASPCKSGSG
jgi:nitrilase